MQAEAIWLFQLDHETETLAALFLVVWLPAKASVMPGIFVSTFARREGQVFPFMPLILLPSIFPSGLLVDELQTWAEWLGHALPLFYANDVIQRAISTNGMPEDAWNGLALLKLASLTLREVE